jgi:hypothetical protein
VSLGQDLLGSQILLLLLTQAPEEIDLLLGGGLPVVIFGEGRLEVGLDVYVKSLGLLVGQRRVIDSRNRLSRLEMMQRRR